jgi:hypothetical protein
MNLSYRIGPSRPLVWIQKSLDFGPKKPVIL